jgi:hypothetical protein
MKKLVYGVGINDLDYNPYKIGGAEYGKVVCPFYTTWKDLLKRCYKESYKAKFKCYAEVTVCPEWLYFSNFKAWMQQQNWEGRHLDKDLLIQGNKHYSPESCLFLQPELNCMLVSCKKQSIERELPLGVVINKTARLKTSYVARDTFNGKSRYLGTRSSSLEAHKLWQKTKLERFNYLQSQQTCERTKQGLQRIIDKLQHHIDNNIETRDL